jgi:predicted component of type VI protein secretion system
VFIVVPKAQADRVRKALAKLEGLPRRATVMRNGVPDQALTAQLGSALDTTDAVNAGDDDGTSVCIDLPQRLEKYLGRTVTIAGQQITLPTADQLAADEAALPAALRAIRQAKRDAAAAVVGG